MLDSLPKSHLRPGLAEEHLVHSDRLPEGLDRLSLCGVYQAGQQLISSESRTKLHFQL